MLERIAHRNLLKYAAGQVMFCPGCETCMDCTRTVNVECLVDSRDGKGERSIKSWTLCASCYDRRKQVFEDGKQKVLAAHTDWSVRYEVIDGREVFGKTKTKKGNKK